MDFQWLVPLYATPCSLAGLLLVVSAGSAHAGDITATSLAEVLTYSRPEILAYTKATMQTAVLLGWRCQAAINILQRARHVA